MGARGLCRPGKEWGGGSGSCCPVLHLRSKSKPPGVSKAGLGSSNTQLLGTSGSSDSNSSHLEEHPCPLSAHSLLHRIPNPNKNPNKNPNRARKLVIFSSPSALNMVVRFKKNWIWENLWGLCAGSWGRCRKNPKTSIPTSACPTLSRGILRWSISSGICGNQHPLKNLWERGVQECP